MLFLVAGLLPAWAAAQNPPAAPDLPPDAVLEAARQQLDGVQKRLAAGDLPLADLADLRSSALDAQASSEQALAVLEPSLAQVEARLAELGPAPDGKGATEAPDVAAQRASLGKQRKEIDAQVKLARLMAVEGGQLADQIVAQRRSQFSARIGERTPSVLAGPFWQDLRASLPRDVRQLRGLADELGRSAGATPPGIWALLGAVAIVVIGLRIWAERRLMQLTATRVPAGRLRRSLLAGAQTLLWVAAPGLIAHLLRLGLTWEVEPSSELQSLLARMVGMVCYGGFVAGMGAALLSVARPSWRLVPLSDRTVRRLRAYPGALALLLVGGWAFEQVGAVANIGLPAAVALDGLYALLLALLLAHALRRVARLRREVLASADDAGEESRSRRPKDKEADVEKVPGQHLSRLPWGAVAAGVVGLLLAFSVVCLLVGYVALGSFLIKQMVWFGNVAMTVYLFNALIDDAFTAWLGRPGGAAPVQPQEDATARLREQAGVLLSAIGRLVVLLCALVLIAAPFGQGPLELLQRTEQLREGLTIGEVKLQPGAVLQALLVFAGGTVAVRLLQRWLRERFLPTTGLDAAMRDSATTLLGFVGTVAALALALSAIGLGLERIAWVASALSVGIGFGLQAIVSNFVSGLILLAERPVKVGDWVSLSGVEGDIRRINVRATEIQMGDRSTVIVPNSEFITKIVRNVTLANPLGQVSFKLPMALDSDVEKVREIILAAFQAHEGVLDTPEPKVFLESVENERLIFAANGAVASPRQAYSVKSALLFDVLVRLRDVGQFPAKPPAAAPTEPQVPPPMGASGVPAPAPVPPAGPA